MYNKSGSGGGFLEICGIIAEFDPFHLGHQHLFRAVREQTGCDYFVCVLSTAFLQRGTPGLFSTRDRARMALEAGADAVFALPVSFSCANADRFALGGVRLLSALGVVTAQAFGCEDAEDGETLQLAAQYLNDEPDAFKAALHDRLLTGMPYPQVQAEALEAACGIRAGLLASPNNILAVAYLRELMRLDRPVRPVFIQRKGSRSETENDHDAPLPSSAIRKKILQEGPDSVRGNVPASTAEIISECIKEGRYCRPESLTQALLYCLYTGSPSEWARYTDSGEGLEHRLQKALDQHPWSREELLSLLKTRRYTHAALQRWLSRIMLGITQDRLAPEPACLRLLGFLQSAQPLMRSIQENASLPLVTKPAYGKEYLAEDARAELIWSLGAGRPESLYEQSPVVLSSAAEDI